MSVIAEIVGAKELTDRLREAGPRIQSGVERAITRSILRLQARVMSQKLSGQVLNVRTGRLRRSITQRVEGKGSPYLTGIVGTNVAYARVHELGFTGAETVREHLRMMTTAFGKKVINPHEVTVRAHQRQVKIPERSFLRTALNEMRPDILAELDRAVHAAASE